MSIATTNGITVRVHVEYQSEYSFPKQGTFLYTYRIVIENDSPDTVQLLHRFWNIKELGLPLRSVNGEGVVGEKPVIESGEKFTYESWTEMNAELGTMEGCYLMQRMTDLTVFEVKIPRFSLTFPFKNN
ncbi:MAG: hypothetical protein RL757_2355 [Bacteroidota bacterium]|jgi:ApaG protein